MCLQFVIKIFMSMDFILCAINSGIWVFGVSVLLLHILLCKKKNNSEPLRFAFLSRPEVKTDRQMKRLQTNYGYTMHWMQPPAQVAKKKTDGFGYWSIYQIKSFKPQNLNALIILFFASMVYFKNIHFLSMQSFVIWTKD